MLRSPSPPRLSNSSPNPTPNFHPSPNSNVVSNPTPNRSHNNSSIISLLPPIPRALSLLYQIATLSSHLFHLSPNRATWTSSYRGSLPSFLPSQPAPSLQVPSLPSSTKELLSLVHSIRTQLFESISHLQEILDLQESTVSLSNEISSLDNLLRQFTKKVGDTVQVLDSLADAYSEYSGRDFKTPNLDLNDVLAYAHKISYTTFAPPEHGAGLAPLRGALPPAPQDNEMRASQLYQFAELDVGVPKNAVVTSDGKEKETSFEVLMERTPVREEFVPGMLLPIMIPPPGWKPGDPVPLLEEVMPVPPGWKPGDPVPLPDLERTERKVVGRFMERPPEVIQVAPVRLDISDEGSSDYSSVVGSSDEDDDD